MSKTSVQSKRGKMKKKYFDFTLQEVVFHLESEDFCQYMPRQN